MFFLLFNFICKKKKKEFVILPYVSRKKSIFFLNKSLIKLAYIDNIK